MADRALLFIDGSNWYHALRDAGVTDLMMLDYSKISQKLVRPREWIGTRYYIGRVRQTGNTRLYADQRRFLSRLESTDDRISVHFGRLEPRTSRNEAAEELRRFLSTLPVRIDEQVFHGLMDLARRHSVTEVMVEKAVDVMIAVDLVVLAERNEFDAAYVLSADGDYTHAVEAARTLGKKVYAATPAYGAQLASAVNSFIRLDRDWFSDCY